MRIHQVSIKNFRLLADVALAFEDRTTVVVGRNNSGKTSLSEIMRRFLNEGPTVFQLEDFSSACYDQFCAAHIARQQGATESAIRLLLPAIELNLICRYDAAQPEFGLLAPFVIDLDPTCSDASIVLRYELNDGKIHNFFDGLPEGQLDEKERIEFFRFIRERIPSYYGLKVWAQDPSDSDNRRLMPTAALRNLVKTGFINAQRGLDDVTSRESDVLARVLEGLFTTAASPMADTADKAIAEALTSAARDIQSQIDTNFSGQLKSLMPTLQSFGYPGLGGQEMRTETTLNIKSLLSNFTKVRYTGYGGVPLPESYNGLGVRNLVFILLQLVGFYKAFRAETPQPGIHVIFIEEPEAHLHPQMQEVFIRQLNKLAQQLATQAEEGSTWPVQFVVSTHSSHIANEAGFESIRYFLATNTAASGIRQTRIKDLRQGLSDTSKPDRDFLHQYLTLTRCDLFFADKAILVEGLSERLLLPIVISKLEAAEPESPKLSSQYVTTMEVGGAYAHIFLKLLDFLELRSLIITDLDSVGGPAGTACAVHAGTTSSNACLRSWFENDDPFTLAGLMAKKDSEKTKERYRIAYQCPEDTDGPCGRTFEDAFILTNAKLFALAGSSREELENNARELAGKHKKSEFALTYAILITNWTTPKYIVDGVRWLATEPTTPAPAHMIAAAAVTPPAEPQAAGGANA